MWFKNKKSRLSSHDAKYVQAIHTSPIVGLDVQLGHSDFFVNGGLPQKGCLLPQPCTHVRAFEYFAESINNKNFIGRSCKSYVNFELGKCKLKPTAYMGGADLDTRAKGRYYLETNSNPPFARS